VAVSVHLLQKQIDTIEQVFLDQEGAISREGYGASTKKSEHFILLVYYLLIIIREKLYQSFRENES